MRRPPERSEETGKHLKITHTAKTGKHLKIYCETKYTDWRPKWITRKPEWILKQDISQ